MFLRSLNQPVSDIDKPRNVDNLRFYPVIKLTNVIQDLLLGVNKDYEVVETARGGDNS